MTCGWSARPVRPGASPFWWERGVKETRGYTAIELLFVAGVIGVLCSISVPAFGRAADHYRVQSAVRYVTARFQRARAEAARQGRNVALRFSATDRPIAFRVITDGNRNGVSSVDIADGIDLPSGEAEDLRDFPGVTFAIGPGLVSPDGDRLSGDPIRFGTSRLASFTPQGTASAGSVYLRGRDGSQYVVRVYGDTGKTIALRFDRRRGVWVSL